MSEQAAGVGDERLPPAPWLAQADGDAPASWAAEGPHPGPPPAPGSDGAQPASAAPGKGSLSSSLSRPEVRLALAFGGGVILALVLKRMAR